MNIRERLKRWRQSWPQPLATYCIDRETEHHCLNCGEDFTGNFCPCCGQSVATRRFTWKSMMTSFLDLWDFDSRSVPSTLLQLCYRPGYLLRHYLQGRRQSYYPPIKLLFMVAVVVTLFEYWCPPPRYARQKEKEETTAVASGDDMEKEIHGYIDALWKWGEENPGWSYLLSSSFLILPTCWFFRRSPGYPHITVPESFFMQAYLCSLLLFCSFMSGYIRAFILTFLPINLLAYKQLFGRGWWSTSWRLFLVGIVGLSMAFLLFELIGLAYFVYLHSIGQLNFPED